MCPLARAGWGREDYSSVRASVLACVAAAARHHHTGTGVIVLLQILFPTMKVCSGGEEGRKQPTAKSDDAGRSSHVTTPCIIGGSGKEREYREKQLQPLLSFF
jgi:hypothetical protein